jgi:DNA-binding CsgD family transcriptional regulator
MVEPVEIDPEFAQLDEVSASAYRQSAQTGRFIAGDVAKALGLPLAEVVRARDNLLELRLLQEMPGDPEVLTPVSPDAAAAQLTGAVENQILGLQQAVTSIRSTVLSLMPAYFEGRRQRNRIDDLDLITNAETVRSMLHTHRMTARREILAIQPGNLATEQLSGILSPMLAALDRGVRLRTIYQHTARTDLVKASYVREVSAQGAEIRTTDEVIDRVIVYDREVAFLPEQHLRDPGRGALVIREPNLVGFICGVFEHLWQHATPFEPEGSSPQPVGDDVKRAILRLMSQGHKDELVARRLGMSVRTCRRLIAEIAEELNATSRFQAGARAAQLGLLDEDVTACLATS